MHKEVEQSVRCAGAFTLVELILVAGTVGLVAGALIGMISNGYQDWKLGNDRSTLLQDGRAAIEQMVRILRQAEEFSAVSAPTDQAGYITFVDVDGETKEFRLDANELKYGAPGSLSTLTSPVNSLVFTCYDIDADSLSAPVSVREIRSVHITATLVDPQDSSLSFTLSGRVFCQEDLLNGMVINEIMYNPPGQTADNKLEWVELYNSGESAVDVNGWTLWTTAPGTPDQLTAHPQFGNGSTTIQAKPWRLLHSFMPL